MEELRSLVVTAQLGDKGAFGRIVTRFQDMAYALAYAMLGDPGLAQDAAQEAFIDAYLSLPNLREPAAFPAWFRRIVVKHSDRQIRGQRFNTIPLDGDRNLPGAAPDPESVIVSLQTRRSVHEAIAALPYNQRAVTTLFYIQGYSQKEISTILELPVSSIKKNLYTARKSLKHRMVTMIQEQLQANKPSRDDQFTRKIQFFLALKGGDQERVKTLIKSDPDLLHVQTEWGVASDGFYWPLGVTGIHWAACTGDTALLKFFIEQGADVNALTSSGTTPLHYAVLMRQLESVRSLLQFGAQVNAASQSGHTPLHYAVLRKNPLIVNLLLAARADLKAVDNGGRTALDWALLKDQPEIIERLVAHGAPQPADRAHTQATSPEPTPAHRQVPVGFELLGRVLDQLGRPGDGLPAPSSHQTQPVIPIGLRKHGPVFETGIKIIDLLAPFKRGGLNAVFTPLAGVGKFVVLDQLVDNLAALYDGYAVCAGLEQGAYTGDSLMLAWRDWGVDDRIVNVFSRPDDSPAANLECLETALTIAEHFRSQAREVMLLVDSRLALSQEASSYLKGGLAVTPQSAVTVVFFGDHTAGAEPLTMQALDSVVTFDLQRARQQLWPAIDPLRSYSRLLLSDLIHEDHSSLAAEARGLLGRFEDLRPVVENRAPEDLSNPQDRQVIMRGRRLQNFLTQPFPGAEPWTGTPGERVKLDDTLQGCQAILEGRCDELPEDALTFIGALEKLMEKTA